MKNNLLLFSILFFFIASASAQSATDEEQALTKLSNDWMKAAMNRDEAVLNKIVAPEFKLGGTDFDNPAIPREMWMKYTMESLTIDSVNYLKMKIDIIGDVAIVQSVFYWSVAFMDTPAKQDTVNLIDTWIKRKQGWQVVSRLVVDK
jgi:hypothetical protein